LSPKLSYSEKIVLALLQDNAKGTLNATRIMSKLPANSGLDKDKVYKALLQLTAKKLANQVSKGNFVYVRPSQEFKGIMEFSRSGESWVILEDVPEGTQDIYVPENMRKGALAGDRVLVETLPGKRKNNGRVTSILERSLKPVIGVLDIFENQVWLLPDKRSFHLDVRIKGKVDPSMDGHKASVLITAFPENATHPEGVIREILGKSGTNDGEMHSIVAEFGFRVEFSEEVQAEMLAFSETMEDGQKWPDRKDLRQVLTLTIDPADAKDFDDAISYRVLENGTFEVGVHIADVSHYVEQNSALDKEALMRGTSVYLADRTIPMLPEKLSNNLCSLRPNEDRLAFSAIFELDAKGTVLSHWFGKSVIHSVRRFSYEEAQDRIVSGEGDLAAELIQLNQIAKALTKARMAKGAMSFESDEIRFELDSTGKPLKVLLKKRFDAHKLIEEFMLLANKEVARYVKTLKKPELPFIYRSHDSPSNEKLVELSKFCQLFGHKIDISNESRFRTTLNQVLTSIVGKPEEDVILQVAIRSMAKAIYTGQRSDHFGLAFDHYTHFTSPIRRYPDLLAHRLFYQYLQEKPGGYGVAEIEAISKQSSTTEQKAAEAERASTKYKMAEYLSERIGMVFEAVISGVTEWGIFAEIIENHCEGMIRLSDIKGDRFTFFERERKVVGARTRKAFHLGDVISVRVKNANPTLRMIDFTLADNY
jgi:ribonuclease R